MSSLLAYHMLIPRVTWKDVSIVWDKLKDESDDTRENLKVYCEALSPLPNYQIPLNPYSSSLQPL